MSRRPYAKNDKLLEVGQEWFVKFPNAVTLGAVRIDELTALTCVLFLLQDGNVGYERLLGRYVRREVTFVELISP